MQELSYLELELVDGGKQNSIMGFLEVIGAIDAATAIYDGFVDGYNSIVSGRFG